MSNSDPGRHLRESIQNLGESYNQRNLEDHKKYKFKEYPITRTVLGLIGVFFVFIGDKLMNSSLHMFFKFVGFVLFGSGILISLHLLAAIVAFVAGVISRFFNRRRLRK